MELYSKDRAKPIDLKVDDPNIFEESAVLDFLESGSYLCKVHADDHPFSPVIGIKTRIVDRNNAGIFTGIVDAAIAALYPNNLHHKLYEHMNITPTDPKWKVCVKLFPTIAALKAAKIDTYCVSVANRNGIRIGIVIPINQRNEKVGIFNTHGVGSSERIGVCTGRSEIKAFPPSLMKSVSLKCGTSATEDRLNGRTKSAGIVFIQLFYMPGQVSSSATMNDHIGLILAKRDAEPVAEYRDQQSHTVVETRVEWNSTRTQPVRVPVQPVHEQVCAAPNSIEFRAAATTTTTTTPAADTGLVVLPDEEPVMRRA